MGLILAGLGVLAFSFSLPLTKIAVRGLDPTVAAVGRAAVASIFAVIALSISRQSRPTREQLWRLLPVVGGVVFGFPLLTAYALRHTASLHGSVVNGLLPLATAGLAVLRAGERPSRRYWACSAVGFAAVVAYVVHEGGGTLHAADALLVLAVLAAAVGYAEGALLARHMGGWQVICWALLLGAPATWLVTIVAASRTGLHATGPQWAAFGVHRGVLDVPRLLRLVRGNGPGRHRQGGPDAVGSTGVVHALGLAAARRAPLRRRGVDDRRRPRSGRRWSHRRGAHRPAPPVDRELWFLAATTTAGNQTSRGCGSMAGRLCHAAAGYGTGSPNK